VRRSGDKRFRHGRESEVASRSWDVENDNEVRVPGYGSRVPCGLRCSSDPEKRALVPRAAAVASATASTNTNQNGPRSRKGAETRARLIDAAKRVFERDGFLEARISDIAETAKLSHGSFYHYFESKEQVFREVAEAQEARLTEPPERDREGTGSGSSPRARIREANRRYLERYRAESAIMGVIEQVSRYDPHVNSVRIATQQHFAERAERMIRRLQREGLADRKLNPEIAADALGAMVGRFAELWLVQGYRDYDFEEAVEQLTNLWGNALGLPDEGSPRQPRGRKRPGARA
jgi:AcrR family transcriptional regulator